MPRGVARRVVVNQDEARRVEPDGIAKELADPHERGRNVALEDRQDL
jgi:hypothetical protein